MDWWGLVRLFELRGSPNLHGLSPWWVGLRLQALSGVDPLTFRDDLVFAFGCHECLLSIGTFICNEKMAKEALFSTIEYIVYVCKMRNKGILSAFESA